MSKIICPKCGTENDEDAKFCINCGRLLLFEPPAPPPPSEVKETRENATESLIIHVTNVENHFVMSI